MLRHIKLIILPFMLLFSITNATAGEGFSDKRTGFFIGNKGQWDSPARFLARTSGLDTWVTGNSIVYDFNKTSILWDGDRENLKNLKVSRKGHVVKMNFIGGNESLDFVASDKLKTYHNYFIGNDPANWASNVFLYREVVVKDIYDGIDLRLYFDNGFVRYDYIVNPGAEPSGIKIRFEGQDDIFIDGDELVLQTSLGRVEHRQLFAYQESESVKSQVGCSFKLNADGILTFAVDNYDMSKPLVIDPLIYSTYLGTTAFSVDAIATGIKVDNDAVYVTGAANNDEFPTTAGAYSNDEPIGNSTHVFVSKLVPDRDLPTDQQLVFSTYFGGEANDFGYDVTVDGVKDIYLTGTTSSNKFPITPDIAYDKFGGYNEDFQTKLLDGFVVKLSSDGSQLLYSTFLGSDRYFYATAIDVDKDKYVYLTGYTNCIYMPLVAPENPAFQDDHGGNTDWDAFILKLDLGAGNNGLLYYTYYGGSQNDEGYGIRVADNGNVYVAGQTKSSDFPTPQGPSGPTNSIPDVYVVKMNLNESGAASRKATYLFGGSRIDQAFDIDMDENEVLYLTGHSESTDLPVTANAIDKDNNGEYDVFVAKVDFNQQEPLQYLSYLGGSLSDDAYGIGFGSDGNVYITGSTASEDDFPVTEYALQDKAAGEKDAFICKMNLAGEGPYELLYSSYLGGSDDETGLAIDFYDNNSIVVAGITKSGDFPVTRRAYNTTGFGDTNTVFITRLDVVHPPLVFDLPDSMEVCSEEEFTFGFTGNVTGGSGKYTYSWLPVEYLDDPAKKDPVATVVTDEVIEIEFSVEVTDDETGVFAEKYITVKVNPLPETVINETDVTEVCVDDDEIYTYTTELADGESGLWSVSNGTPVGTPPYTGDNFGVKWDKAGVGKVILTKTIEETGCSNEAEFTITVNPKPEPEVLGNIEVCSGCSDTYTTEAGDSIDIKWKIENGSPDGPDNEKSFEVTWNDVGEGSGKIICIHTNKTTGCMDSIVVDITITKLPKPTVNGPVENCEGDLVEYSTPAKEDAQNTWSVTGGQIIGADDGEKVQVLWEAPPSGEVSLRQVITELNYDEKTDLSVTIYDSPDPKITGKASVKPNDTEQYNTGFDAESEYDWILEPAANGEINQTQNKNIINVEWKTPGTVRLIVTQTNVNDCSSSDTLLVTIDAGELTVSGPTDVCAEDQVEYTTATIDGFEYQWDITGGIVLSGQGTAIAEVRWDNQGSGSVKLTRTFTETGSSEEKTLDVTVNPKPVKPVISRTGTDLENLESSPADSYQWYMDGQPVSGAINRVYTPDPDVVKSYTVVVANQFGCTNESDQYIFGPVDTYGELSIRANPEEGKTGEVMNVEIYLEKPEGLDDPNAAKSIRADLILNGKMLIPVDNSMKGTVANDIRTIPLEIELPANAGNGEMLLSIPFVAVLDKYDRTDIKLQNIQPQEGLISLGKVTPGLFVLSDVCYEGGNARFVVGGGNFEILSVTPNPAGNSCEIEFETEETGVTELFLMNAIGEKAKTLAVESYKRGTHTVNSDLSDVPSGLYYLVIKSPSETRVVNINIVK